MAWASPQTKNLLLGSSLGILRWHREFGISPLAADDLLMREDISTYKNV